MDWADAQERAAVLLQAIGLRPWLKEKWERFAGGAEERTTLNSSPIGPMRAKAAPAFSSGTEAERPGDLLSNKVSAPTALKLVPRTGATPRKRSAARAQPVGEGLEAALDTHPLRAELIELGQRRDQLLRALIPLYLAGPKKWKLSSGTISGFWSAHGHRFAAPNAAKALRQHPGHARLASSGRQITSRGIQYVEAALGTRSMNAVSSPTLG